MKLCYVRVVLTTTLEAIQSRAVSSGTSLGAACAAFSCLSARCGNANGQTHRAEIKAAQKARHGLPAPQISLMQDRMIERGRPLRKVHVNAGQPGSRERTVSMPIVAARCTILGRYGRPDHGI